MKKIFLLFIIFYFSKKIFRLPKKVDILIYDNFDNEIYLNLFSKHKIGQLDIRFKEINIIIFFRCIFKNGFKNIIFNYSIDYIRYSQPKIVITLVDTHINFYKFKNFISGVKFISVQHAYRSISHPDLFQDIMLNNINNLKCDYLFCFGQKVAEFYRKFIKCESIVIGSLRNNAYINLYKKKLSKKKTIGFISQYRSANYERGHNYISGTKRSEFYKSEYKILPLLSNFCKVNNYDLCIIGCSIQGSDNEFQFYKSILKNNDFFFLKTKGYKDSYYNSEFCDIIVFIDSTLGYEMLGRGKKSICIHSRPSFYKVENKFGWPSNCSNRGFFWTNNNCENEVMRIINNVNNCDFNKWQKQIQFIRKEIMFFDKNNTILKRKINTILQVK